MALELRDLSCVKICVDKLQVLENKAFELSVDVWPYG